MRGDLSSVTTTSFIVVMATWLGSLVDGSVYYMHRHCNRTLHLGPDETGQIRITSAMPSLNGGYRSVVDCELSLRTSFTDERIRISQRQVDRTIHESGEITVSDDGSNPSLPLTSTSRKVTLHFKTESVKNPLAVDVTIDFSVIGDPWLLRDQVNLNTSLLIAILVLLIITQLVVVFKLCRAGKNKQEDDGSNGGANKNNSNKLPSTGNKTGAHQLAPPHQKPSSMKPIYGDETPRMAPKVTKPLAAPKDSDDTNYYIKDSDRRSQLMSAPSKESIASRRSL